MYDMICKSVVHAITKKLNYKEEKITPDTVLDVLDINSIDFIETLVSLEEEFGIEFEDSYLSSDSFTNIQSIIQYIQQKVK